MQRPIRSALVAASVAATVGLVPVAEAADGGRPYRIVMSGAQETSAADPDGSGTAYLQVNAGLGQVCYELAVVDIAPATAAHIHRAPTGVAGPVVVPLAAPTDGSSEGCATISRALALELLSSPEGFYVNVHNAEFPAGAVRGQLG